MPAEQVRILEERIASGKYSPEQVAKAKKWIADYQSKVAESHALSLGSPTAPSGTEGLATNPLMRTTQRVVTPGAPAEEEYEIAPRRRAQFKEDLPEQESVDPVVGLRAEAAARLEAAQAAELLSQLPTLSKEPELARPPEFKGKGGMYGSPLAAVPFLGERVWYEPTPDQFRREMAPYIKSIGADTKWEDDDMVRMSPEYQRFADAKWAEAYDAAQQSGRSIIRQSQMKGAAGDLTGALKHVFSGALGADEALTGGLMTEGLAHLAELAGEEGAVEATRALRESSPIGRALGNIGGALHPLSLASKLAGWGIRATGAAGGGALRAAGAGAIAGSGQIAAEEGIRLGSDLLRGEDVGTEDLLASGERVGLGAALGGAVGSLADPLSRGAGRFRDYMRTKPGLGRQLRTAEAAGAEPSGIPFTRRFKETPEMTGLRSRALASEMEPGELVAKELSQPIASAALRKRGTELAPVAQKIEAYKAATDGIRVRADEFGDEVLRSISSRLGEGGTELPGVSTAALKDIFTKTFQVHHVPREEVQSAIARGLLPVDRNIERLLQVGVPDEHLTTFLSPRRMNPRELEQVIDTLTFRAKPTVGIENPDKEIFKALNVAARRVRDRFPPPEEFGIKSGPSYRMPDGTEVTGYSALNAQYSEISDAATKQQVRAGLPEDLRQAPRRLGTAPERVSEETVASLKQQTDEMFAGLTPDEQLAVTNLSKTLSKRGMVQDSPDLESALQKLEIQNPTQHGTLYRGEELTPAELESVLQRGEFSREWRVPTSYNRDVSELYSRPLKPTPGKVPVLFRIKDAERGSSLVSDQLSLDLEEVLLPRGTRFKVLGSTVDDTGTTVIDVATEGSQLARSGGGVKFDAGQERRLGESIRKYKSATGRVDEDAALREFAEEAGVAGELEALAGVNAVDSIDSGISTGIGFGVTPSGLYPRLGGTVRSAAEMRAYPGAKAVAKLPPGANPEAPKVSDALRGVLAVIRRDPRTAQAARMGILPKASDYHAFGMRGGGQAGAVAGALGEQSGEAGAAPLPDEAIRLILEGGDSMSALPQEQMGLLERLLDAWRGGKPAPQARPAQETRP